MTKILKLTNDEKQPLQLILELTNIPPAIYDELVEMTEAFYLETKKVFERHQAEFQERVRVSAEDYYQRINPEKSYNAVSEG